ncbi:hypothetical protein Pint_14707 [Pistacia integerrima]|uniref:Uncharacterized protein n=1 Tax=Pistacia integerrima TaxID=434235 RepID=A0ACC0Y7X1_9ROSI|nr:hypothetical protein Pint_14707 [Pistacia integerrima]
MEREEPSASPSLKQKLKLSLTPSCFPVHHKHHHHHHHHQSNSSETLSTSDAKTRLIRMSSNPWLKNRSHHSHDVPELKDKCRYLISRIGGGSKHSRRHSIDCNYDASSYALNFDDDDKNLDEEPLKGFSSRLPPSPNRELKAL